MKIKAKHRQETAYIPELSMTREEFLARVRKAEQGPFYTLEEGKKMIEEWRQERKNL